MPRQENWRFVDAQIHQVEHYASRQVAKNAIDQYLSACVNHLDEAFSFLAKGLVCARVVVDASSKVGHSYAGEKVRQHTLR